MEDENNLPKKKKFIRLDTIILLILIIVALIIASYFLKSTKPIGNCESSEDCGMYNVFYMKGEGYVCANKAISQDGSIKTRVLMFRYASKNANSEKPNGCSCIENQCKTN